VVLSFLFRWISWLRPVRVARAEGRAGTLEVRWERGRKVLNSPHANQSFGSLHRVWQQVLGRLDLPANPPARVLLLGLGGGSALRILRDELQLACAITAVEWDPAVVAVAREHFGLERHADVPIIAGDAVVQVQVLAQRFDLVLVDLFDDLDLARGVDTQGFAHGLRDRCAENGIVCFNTVSHDEASEARCQKVMINLAKVFHSVEELRTEGLNRVFITR
jgi:spermidine synthase